MTKCIWCLTIKSQPCPAHGQEKAKMSGPHPSHVTRFSDASTFDEICVNCGATDQVPGGWGKLAYPCPNPKEK